jgi:hypothetical protein
MYQGEKEKLHMSHASLDWWGPWEGASCLSLLGFHFPFLHIGDNQLLRVPEAPRGLWFGFWHCDKPAKGPKLNKIPERNGEEDNVTVDGQFCLPHSLP